MRFYFELFHGRPLSQEANRMFALEKRIPGWHQQLNKSVHSLDPYESDELLLAAAFAANLRSDSDTNRIKRRPI